MMAIVEFLTARLDEKERAAKRPGGSITEMQNDNYGQLLVPSSWVLADIAAKRLIIGWHSDNPHECEGPLGSEYVPDDDSRPCSTMCALALPDVDHPDYQQEWKP